MEIVNEKMDKSDSTAGAVRVEANLLETFRMITGFFGFSIKTVRSATILFSYACALWEKNLWGSTIQPDTFQPDTYIDKFSS